MKMPIYFFDAHSFKRRSKGGKSVSNLLLEYIELVLSWTGSSGIAIVQWYFLANGKASPVHRDAPRDLTGHTFSLRVLVSPVFHAAFHFSSKHNTHMRLSILEPVPTQERPIRISL